MASQAANKITSVKSQYPVVGVIGAGQLARMMVAPATALGIKLIPFASSNEDSAAQITHCVIGDYKDLEAVKKCAKQCDETHWTWALRCRFPRVRRQPT